MLVNGTRLQILGPADCFGEIAALTGSRRTGTVRADTELRLLRFTRDHFVRAVTHYAPSHAAATTLVQERLADAAASTARAGPDVDRLRGLITGLDPLRVSLDFNSG